MPSENLIETDVLIIGGGISGLFAAIKAREQGVKVTLVDKGYVGKTGASIFGGGFYGFFSVFNPAWGHDLDVWLAQINKTCEYVNNPEWTGTILKDSYATYQDLVSWGVEFEKNEDGEPRSFRENAPLEALRMRQGRRTPELVRKQAVRSGVDIMDRVMIIDLIKQDGRVIGACGFHIWSGDWYVFKSKATIISAGSGSFKQMGMPIAFLTGDGHSMAYRAGAEISSKEFWHTLSNAYHEERPDTKTSVGEYVKTAEFSPGWITYANPAARFCRLLDAEGYEVSRAASISAVHLGRAPILWDIDSASQEDFDSMMKELKASGMGFQFERIGVDLQRRGKVPGLLGAAGFVGQVVQGGTGGITAINTECATCVPGLYASGDSCDTRATGARYPSFGFGLRTAAVTGARAGRSAAQYAQKTERITLDTQDPARLKAAAYTPMDRKGGFSPAWVTQQIQNIMTPYYIWSVRRGDRLKAALTMIEFLKNDIAPKLAAKDIHELRSAHETKSMVLNAEMMLRSALFRTESRGSHYREDYPRRDDPNWLAWVKLKDREGRMRMRKERLPRKWWPDLSKPYNERYPDRFIGE